MKIEIITQNSFASTAERPYWRWECDQCGFDDNRNSDQACQKCQRRIQCISGHWFRSGEVYCAKGCGKHRNGTVDPAHRREDYLLPKTVTSSPNYGPEVTDMDDWKDTLRKAAREAGVTTRGERVAAGSAFFPSPPGLPDSMKLLGPGEEAG